MTTVETAGPLRGASCRRIVPRPGRQTLLVLLMAVGQLGLAAAVGRHVLLEAAPGGWLTLPWWVLALGFAASELFVLNIQVRREATSIALGELPLVLGMFFAAPGAVVIGRMIGMAVICLVHRRSPLLKTSWNVAFVALHTTVAVVVFRAVSDGVASDIVRWAGAYAGTLVAHGVGCVPMALVVAIYDGGLRLRQLLRNMVLADPGAPIMVTLGLVAVTCLAASPHSFLLLLLTGVGLMLAYRTYSSLAERHLNLERLYRFTQAVSSSPEGDEVLSNVLAQAKEMLTADHAEIAFVSSPQGLVARVALGSTGRLRRSEDPRGPHDDWLLRHVITDAQALLLPRATRDPQQRSWLDSHSSRDAVAVPLRGGAGVLGALIVTDRLGEVRGFDQDDVLLLETVANHASVALQNGELIDQLRHEALHDALTGLPNRANLQRRLAMSLDEIAEGRAAGAAVMILDLDRFKEVNDTLGHHQGDLLLVEIGERLRAAVGSAGVVARLGGDEFSVLVPGTADEDRAVEIGRRMLRALEQPVALDGIEVEVGGSIGIAFTPAHATDTSGLLKRADMAMYDAKASARGLRIYEPDLESGDPQRLTLVAELRAALNDGDIQVYVQPQARLRDGSVTGGEALVRWEHPELGFLSPDSFVPLAERSGLIGLLTTRVLDLSLAAVAAWRGAGQDLGIAVNLSARSLQDADLVDDVRRLLRRHDVPASRLTLEVTEGSVMADPARAIALLHQLRELGVRLSVDDFGTGYSSLSYLKKLPVEEVKIDRSFVTGLQPDGEDAAIVRAIVDLGRHLSLDIVAEGVEDQDTWDLLDGMGCDIVQGWHLGRPMPVAEFLPWLMGHGTNPLGKPTLHAV